MPGKIATKQVGDWTKTADLSGNQLTFVANRDTQGKASGSLYIDDGVSLNQDYNYYQFLLSANSLKKWDMGSKG